MRVTLYLLILSCLKVVYASELSCSANGLDIFYVNGIFNKSVEDNKENLGRKRVEALLSPNLTQHRLLNNGNKVRYDIIFNESHFLLDFLEMSWQKTYIRTGVQLEYGVTAVANELDSKSIEDGLAVLSEGGMLGDKASTAISNTYLKTKQAMIEHTESRKQIMKEFQRNQI